jgi:SAM-dependent methyltransferase
MRISTGNLAVGFWLLAVAGPIGIALGQPARPPTAAKLPLYEWREPHDPTGIGKFYLGREIAQVMGHEGADWLDRPEREAEENPSLLLESLKIRTGDVIADIGAGSGYLTFPLARLAGRGGRVYAVDVQQEMIDILNKKKEQRQAPNVVPVLGTITNAALPESSVDLAVLVDVYHEFSHPCEMVESICQALKPGGRLVFVEYRAEDPAVPIKRLHKMTEAQVRKEMTPQPLDRVEAIEVLPRQHIIVFKKRR